MHYEHELLFSLEFRICRDILCLILRSGIVHSDKANCKLSRTSANRYDEIIAGMKMKTVRVSLREIEMVFSFIYTIA
jgi:hypothetical protein